MGFVKIQQSSDVQVSDTVSICEHEGLVVGQPVAKAFQTSTSVSVQPGINKMDLPLWLAIVLVNRSCARRQVNRHVAAERVEVQEVVLNDFSFVPECYDKLGYPIGRKDVHDVPQDRLAAA